MNPDKDTPIAPMPANLTCVDLGQASYQHVLDVQERLVQRVAAGRNADGYLLLVEHEPAAITLGRGAEATNIMASRDELARMGIEVHETRRGGDVTWHGRGQLVGYPILRLDIPGRSVRLHVRRLEEGIIRLLERLGLAGRRIGGMTGVWAGDGDDEKTEKVAAIGIAVRKWVSYHGFALNVCCDLSQFDSIVPCGLTDRSVTSLQKLLARPVSTEEIRPPLVQCVADALGFSSIERGRPEDDGVIAEP